MSDSDDINTPTGSDHGLSPEEELRARILGETSRIAWQELQKFFAAGNAVAVHPSLDLIEVAFHVSSDNTEQVEAWMKENQVGVVSDAQALEWLEANALMWAVVIKPWILVQPVMQDADAKRSH